MLTGSDQESKLAKRFKHKCPTAIDLTNKTSVTELAALMSLLRVYITPDTGTLHVACATEVPLIAMFSKTDPVRTGPYPAHPSRVCLHYPDLAACSVDRVYDLCLALMAPQDR